MNLPYEEYLKSLPRKRVSSAAIFFNEKNELLIVKPNYKKEWLVPGGTVEAFESPKAGCVREIKEEIGLDLSDLTLLGVNYVRGVMKNGDKDDGLHFIFYAGVLHSEQITKITLQGEELDEFKFVPLEEAYNLLSERLSKRVKEAINAMNNKTFFYSEYEVK